MGNFGKTVLYFDLNEPPSFERYFKGAYGGGTCVARAFIDKYTNFYICAHKDCFEEVPKNKIEQCIILSDDDIRLLRSGAPLKDIKSIPESIKNNADIILHHFHNLWINCEGLKAKEACWHVGYGEVTHHNREHLLLYSRAYQASLIQKHSVKIYDVLIGKPIPGFRFREKQDYICQISRHNRYFGSIEAASWCLENKVKGIFAGPIDQDYSLLEYIDNKTTFYEGIVSNERKFEITANARLYTLLYDLWPVPFSLSMIEALSLSTPVVTKNIGFTPSVIRNNHNGFIINGKSDLSKAWDNASKLKPLDIYNSSLPYSSEKMVSSFESAFNQI